MIAEAQTEGKQQLIDLDADSIDLHFTHAIMKVQRQRARSQQEFPRVFPIWKRIGNAAGSASHLAMDEAASVHSLGQSSRRSSGGLLSFR